MTSNSVQRTAGHVRWRNALATALLLACGGAHAALVTAGQRVLFNVDMTGLSPAPVYDAVSITPSIGSLDGTDVAGFQVFNDLGAQGGVALSFAPGQSPFVETAAGVLDGLFSIIFTVTAGEVDLDPVQVFGSQTIGPNEFIDTPVLSLRGRLIDDTGPPATVPEPASLGLAGLALLAGVVSRRRLSSRFRFPQSRDHLKTRLSHPFAIRAAAPFKLAAPKVLLTALLMIAPCAQASLIVGQAQRLIRTFAAGADVQQSFIETPSGAINVSLQSEEFLDTGDGAQSKAFQFSDITPTAFVGTGGSEALMRNGSFADAGSFDTIFFTLTGTLDFVGSATLSAGGDIRSLAGLRLEQLGLAAQVLLDETEASGSFDFAGTLQPGDYQLSAFAFSTGPLSFNPLSVGGSAGFAFSIIFLDADIGPGDPPPTSVPEPASLGLAGLALTGLLVSRRARRKVNAQPDQG